MKKNCVFCICSIPVRLEVATSGKKLKVAASLMNCNWPSLDTSIATKQIIAADDDDDDDDDNDT